MHISRRRFLALSATFSVAACSGSDTNSASTTTDNSSSATTSSTTSSTTTSTAAPATNTTTTIAEAPATTTEPAVELPADPFVFGVGSGDPDATSVVLWTRLDGELPAEGIAVDWQFVSAGGSTFEGSTTTSSELGGSVHVEVEVDGPGEYSFSAGGWSSPSGQSAPIDATAGSFRFATASCQHFETGHYAAHRDIAEWAPDLVVFLGDFIYEGDPVDPVTPGIVRSHEGPEVETLDAYRARYATYLSDPHLQACRAAAPWLAIWDDHEVENNYAALVSENDDDPVAFGGRRSAAYRVWWENTPTRLPAPPADVSVDDPYVIYRGLDVGSLLRISAIDGRQFRDPLVSQAILETGPPADGWDAPDRTMLGADQEAWLAERFSSSAATWNCLAQQTVFSDTRLGEPLTDNRAILNYDQWDGYHPARERVLENAPSNFVTVTGDIHLAGVGSIDLGGAPVGVEFVTTAISSSANVDPALRDVVLSIPAIVDAELEFRGYTRHTVTAAEWSAEYRQVEVISDPASAVRTWKTFRVESGTPSVSEA